MVGLQIEQVAGMNKKTRILVVDDNPEILRLFSEMLRVHGYEVLEASTGRRGLQMTRQMRPDLLLLDVVMPDLNGIEVCRRVKSDPQLADIFVVLVSGQATSSAERVSGLEAGADEYIAKPVDSAEFLARLRTIVRLRDTTAALRASEQHSGRWLTSCPRASFMIDLAGRFAAVNPQAVAMLGFAAGEELLMKSVVELIPPEDQKRFNANIASAWKTGIMPNAEYTLMPKGGATLCRGIERGCFNKCGWPASGSGYGGARHHRAQTCGRGIAKCVPAHYRGAGSGAVARGAGTA